MATTDVPYQERDRRRCDSFVAELADDWRIHIVGKSLARQSAAHKLLRQHHRFNGGEQFAVGIRLQYITVSMTESYTRHLYIKLLGQEENLGFGSDFTNPSSASEQRAALLNLYPDNPGVVIPTPPQLSEGTLRSSF